jgi:DNA-binding NtrC family response regulator
MPRALVVEDSRGAREGLEEWLVQHGFEVRGAGTVADARRELRREQRDLVLLDLELPDGNGLDVLHDLEEYPDTEVVVITGHGSTDSAVRAFRGGAVDYLEKPVDLDRLNEITSRFHRTFELRQQVRSLQDELRRIGRFGSMLGRSEAMQAVYDLAGRVAPTNSTVLLLGETGTGKELMADTIHRMSARAKQPFLPVNCGAVPANLIESELFGHEKGSFTGADRQHRGIFERAHGGTLFLDEISEMPVELQVRLLRVIETRTLTRVGGDRPIEVDVRLITATNRDLDQAVRDGKFREDLLYRLNVFPIEVPPLRRRGDDVELLANHFLEELNRHNGARKRLTPAAVERLRQHGWPGNVRELKNTIERAYIVGGEELGADVLPLASGQQAAPAAADGSIRVEIGTSIAEAERALILETLRHAGGNKQKAAGVLGISLKTLYNRLNKYGG